MFYMLLRHRDVPDINQIDVYQKNGGFDALKKALKMDTADVTNEVKAAGLRGRGGAGFLGREELHEYPASEFVSQ